LHSKQVEIDGVVVEVGVGVAFKVEVRVLVASDFIDNRGLNDVEREMDSVEVTVGVGVTDLDVVGVTELEVLDEIDTEGRNGVIDIVDEVDTVTETVVDGDLESEPERLGDAEGVTNGGGASATIIVEPKIQSSPPICSTLGGKIVRYCLSRTEY